MTRFFYDSLPCFSRVLISTLVLWIPITNAGGQPSVDKTIEKVTSQSDLIVSASIVGLVDRKPAAQKRRTRELHRVRVNETLKGDESTGDELLVRPNGNHWLDGKSYILFLKDRAGRFYDVTHTHPVEASEANISAIREVISTTNGSISPKVMMQVQSTPGWGIQANRLIKIFENGLFTDYSMLENGETTIRTGDLDALQMTRLIQQMERSTHGIRTDDGGILQVRWRGDKNEMNYAEFDLMDGNPGASLLKAIIQITGN